MKRAHEDVRMITMSYPRCQHSMASSKSPAWTYGKDPVYARPHGVVGQLSPAALVHDCALVDTTTDKVD